MTLDKGRNNGDNLQTTLAKETEPMATRKTTATPKTKEVVKTGAGGTLATPFDYGEYAGVGAEDIEASDLLMPFIRIADPKSPQVQKRSEKYIKDLQPGQFFNVTTNRIYGDPNDDENGFPFVAHVCAKHRGFAEYIPRNDDGTGGGFVAQHPDNYPLALELSARQGSRKKLQTDQGTELAETYYLFLLIPPDDLNQDPDAVVIPAASTHITPVRQLLTKFKPLSQRRIPIFAPRIRVSTRYRQRPGQAWFVPNFEFDGQTMNEYLISKDDPLFQVCVDLREAAVSGRATVDYETQYPDDPITSNNEDDEAAF